MVLYALHDALVKPMPAGLAIPWSLPPGGGRDPSHERQTRSSGDVSCCCSVLFNGHAGVEARKPSDDFVTRDC
jgi:hypothetical protein